MSDIKEIDHILQLVISRNETELGKYKRLPARALIDALKNDLVNLDYFFSYMKDKYFMPGSGSYHFTDIKDNATFDIYHKHHFIPTNFLKETVTPEQWDYAYKIGYITKKQYKKGSA